MQYQITEKSNGTQEFQSFIPFGFQNGETLCPLTLAFETFGQLSAQKDNVIVVNHALSTDSHLCSSTKNPNKGWWESAVGPGKAIDTDKFFVICINNLGSCFGSSSPLSINPSTQTTYQSHFPFTTITDMVNSQQLLLDHLGIKKIHAIIGNSMGAMLSLTWAILFPENIQRLICISSCYKTYPSNNSIHNIQKQIIRLDPEWQQGFYTTPPLNGFRIARKIGHLYYRNPDEFNQRFNKEELENYLEHNANKFISHFDVNCYLYLLEASDAFDVTQAYINPLEPFQKISAKSLIVSVDSDKFMPPVQQQELYDYLQQAGVDATLIQHHSDYGHDSFYTDAEIGNYIRQFIA
jgi:homoserine O-acetyltransferase